MIGPLREIVRVDVDKITTLEEIQGISKGSIAVFSDRKELVIKNDQGGKNPKWIYITTISNGDSNGIKETSYFCKKEKDFPKKPKKLIDYMIHNHQKNHDQFDTYEKMLKAAGLK